MVSVKNFGEKLPKISPLPFGERESVRGWSPPEREVDRLPRFRIYEKALSS